MVVKTAKRLMDRPLVHIILIAALGILIYSNTLNVPFQWDEYDLIVTNAVVNDLSYYFEPSKIDPGLKNRYIGYLTFALNYKLHGTDVAGYHVVNIAVHILNATLVYLLVILTFRTPFLSEALAVGRARLIALFSALLFVSHPVQTEAVTYIFQRLASLVAFFYLLSIVSYAGARLSDGRHTRYAFYAASLVSAILAMKTKENAFTLPITISLYEFLFFRGPFRPRIFRLVPLLSTLFIIPLALVGVDKPPLDIINGLGTAISGYLDTSSRDYLYTQFRVIVTYIRLLLFPINQNIDYDYTIYHSFLIPEVCLSSIFLASIIGSAFCLLYFSSRFPGLRLVAFGIFWFFITLSVESSVIPIPMVINEYRVYLPSVGAFIGAGGGSFWLKRRRVGSGHFLSPYFCRLH